jgi:anti-sigma B factor antagonist
MFSTVMSTSSYDGYTVVALRGELDVADAAAVAAGIARIAACEPGIIVDLAGLSFIDCSGVAALEHAREQARQAGGGLVLAAPHRNVTRVLAILRLPDAFSVYATTEEAAREAGHIRAGAMPTSHRPRNPRWPHALLWSRTYGLRTVPGTRTTPTPAPAASATPPSPATRPRPPTPPRPVPARPHPPTPAGPEEQSERECH